MGKKMTKDEINKMEVDENSRIRDELKLKAQEGDKNIKDQSEKTSMEDGSWSSLPWRSYHGK